MVSSETALLLSVSIVTVSLDINWLGIACSVYVRGELLPDTSDAIGDNNLVIIFLLTPEVHFCRSACQMLKHAFQLQYLEINNPSSLGFYFISPCHIACSCFNASKSSHCTCTRWPKNTTSICRH